MDEENRAPQSINREIEAPKDQEDRAHERTKKNRAREKTKKWGPEGPGTRRDQEIEPAKGPKSSPATGPGERDPKGTPTAQEGPGKRFPTHPVERRTR